MHSGKYLNMHPSNSKKLFYGRTSLLDQQKDKRLDFANMWAITDRYTPRGNIIDRLGRIQSTFNYEVYKNCQLPTDLTNFNMSYKDCCLEAAKNLLESSRNMNKPLLLMYSGGVDSTSILVSLMMLEDINSLKDKVVVCMSIDSIREYTSFYYKFIQKNFKIVSSLHLPQYFNKDYIVVTGDLADMTYPYKLTEWAQGRYGNDAMMDNWQNGLYHKWWVDSTNSSINEKTDLQKDLWWELLVDNINHAPCEIKSNFDFFWWIYFNLKFQHFYFGYSLASMPTLDKDLIDKYYKVFFSSQNFQKWSMLVGRYHTGKNDYKPHAKQFIFDFTKDNEYFNRKGKKVSLQRVLIFSYHQNKSIDSNASFVDDVDMINYYNPNNSFNK